MLVRDIMTKDPVACHVDQTLNDAARVMWDRDCGAVPIVEDHGRLVAMLTDRDIAMAAYTQGRALSSLGIASAMSKNLVVCRDRDTVAAAEVLMRTQKIRRLPVIDDQGALCGILSLGDIATHGQLGKRVRVAKNELDGDSIARTLAAICAHPEARAAAE